MKKKLQALFSVILLVLCILFIHKLLIKKHKVIYKIENYTIKEEYYKKNKDYYDITISKGKQIFIYTISKNLNKQKKIIEDIKTYKHGDLVCILPLYKKNIEKEIYCNILQEQVSIDYLLKTQNENFEEIIKKVKKYNLSFPTDSETKTKYKNIEVYNENILEKNIYYLWNYKGIYILEKDKNSYQAILNYDLYDNVLSCVVEDKFVLLENTSIKGIENVYYYNLTQKKMKKIELKNSISKDSYINGVVGKLIYITDRRQKKEYTLELAKKELKEISKDGNYTVYQNGKKEVLSKSDFFMQDQLFDTRELTPKEVGNYVYYIEEEKIYKYRKTNKEHPILLLELENIKEWQVRENEIILLKEDAIYSYSNQNGLRKIVESNELNYNYKNIYQIGEK